MARAGEATLYIVAEPLAIVVAPATIIGKAPPNWLLAELRTREANSVEILMIMIERKPTMIEAVRKLAGIFKSSPATLAASLNLAASNT